MATAPPIPASAPVGIRVDKDGRLRVGNSRVLVEMILSLHRAGETAEQLLGEFPSMDVADLYSTIAFYHRNKAEMDVWLDEVEQEYEAAFAAARTDPGQKAFAAKLRERANTQQIPT